MTAPENEADSGGGAVSPEQFARVRAVFEAALERVPSDRSTFVGGACAGDPALEAEVQAMLAAEAATDPRFDRPPSTPPSNDLEEGRFPPGTILAGRYRIHGLLGRGGMGEVYRAHDLILNQTVALKFLASAHVSEAALARFRNEVRIARQVSHPHVCRVYDLGVVEGLHFLSMEYIDGEDLASLLRRIGRLPPDKAIELTRKICAGLSAAHERGVLHRDLKPANIMIDGRGQPRITDFGLAGLVQEIPLSDLRSGTPDYMSPEQKAGKGVTVRSDFYALGLVLYEMFTGKSRQDTSSNPSELVKDLDPAIERVILRCLEKDPKRRPSSAFNIVMALPGADPIAAALAAGETPSPEMVAASREKEGLSKRTAVMCFLAGLVFLVAGTFLLTKTSLLSRSRLESPPEVLAFQAQTLLKELGYAYLPESTAYGFDLSELNHIAQLRGPREQSERILVTQQPPILRYWYRQHQDRFYADTFLDFVYFSNRIQYDAPANTEPGMIRLAMDGKGRLIALEVRPTESGQGGSPDWMPLFKAAGLDISRFIPADPLSIPPVAADTRAAWTGTYDEGRTENVRIEAASWTGRPVYFSVTTGGTPDPGFAPPWAIVGIIVFIGGSLIGALVLAWRHFRSGRADPRGAAMVFWITFISHLGLLALGSRHVVALWEIHILLACVCQAGLFGIGASACYLAIEPYVRRHWPDSLISWKRTHSGRARDGLVASHVLAGIVAMLACQHFGLALLAAVSPARAVVPGIDGIVWGLSSDMAPVSLFLLAIAIGIPHALLLLTTVVLLRFPIRPIWIADTVAAILAAAFWPSSLVGGGFVSTVGTVHAVITAGVVVWLMRRFGLLAATVACLMLFLDQLHYIPGTWFAGRALTMLAIPIVAAAWALWVIVSDGRQPSMDITPG